MTIDPLRRAREFLLHRAGAYRRAFSLESRDAQWVLADLAKFCRAHATTFHADARLQAQLEGRREVWLRLQHHLQLTDDQLWLLYGGRNPAKGD